MKTNILTYLDDIREYLKEQEQKINDIRLALLNIKEELEDNEKENEI